MIIRLHGEEVAHTSRGTPSFEDDFVDESDDSLRREFLELLDKAATTAHNSTHADQALGASIVAAGSISVVTPKVDAETKSGISEPIDLTIQNTAMAAPSEVGRQGVDQSGQSPLSTRSFDSDGREAGGGGQFSETFQAPANGGTPSGEENTSQSVEVSSSEQGTTGGHPSTNGALGKGDAPISEDLLFQVGGDTTNSGTPDGETDGAAEFGDGALPLEVTAAAETTAQATPVSSPLAAAKFADAVDQSPRTEVVDTAISAEGSTQNQISGLEPSLQGGSQQSSTVEVTTKGGGELAQLLASVKQEQITLPPDEGDKKQIEVANPFLANAIPLLQRPDAAVKLALLKQSFEQLKGAVGELKGAQGSNQSLSSQLGTQPQVAGVSAQVASGEISSRTQLGFQKEASRPLPKGIAHRTMERVESALKEAAKSRDGKTLSFRLDPPQLGQVKVDVSLKDGALHARMVPENAQVATLLREKASELQSTLRRLGLNVETVTVSVGNESGSISYNGGESSLDGKTFQQERNNMPGQGAQVVDTTFGNELALQGPATKTVVDDHWVA